MDLTLNGRKDRKRASVWIWDPSVVNGIACIFILVHVKNYYKLYSDDFVNFVVILCSLYALFFFHKRIWVQGWKLMRA